jgi:hypothetical protein
VDCGNLALILGWRNDSLHYDSWSALGGVVLFLINFLDLQTIGVLVSRNNAEGAIQYLEPHLIRGEEYSSGLPTSIVPDRRWFDRRGWA